jgi:hypothetical protein
MASDTNSPTQSNVRGLQYIWVPEHSVYLFCWCADDGELDRNGRIAYACVSSPSEFSPQAGQFILTQGDSSQAETNTYTFVYGVPYAIYSVGGSIKILFTDLTPALGNPRQALGETSPDTANAGKTAAKTGWCLEGQWCKEDLTNGPLLWTLKDNNLHNNPVPIIEVTDTADVTSSNNGVGAPCGALLVQYQRDSTGRIITDTDGIPQIALIKPLDASNGDTNTAQNYKIGYLALTFTPNYFGVGLHGWIGSSVSSPGPFDFTAISSAGLLTIFPGTINNLLPDTPFTPLDCSAQALTYVTLACTTNSNQVNQASYKAVDTVPTPPPAVMGAPPPSFSILLGIVTKDSSSGSDTYAMYKTLPKGNLLATPLPWIQTDKEAPQPNGLPYDQWYSWNITSTLQITINKPSS